MTRIELKKVLKEFLKKIPKPITATVIMFYWGLHPYREGVLLIPRRDSWLVRRRDGSEFLIPTPLRGHGAFALGEPYEKYFQVEQGDVVLDVGAGLGGFSIHAAKRASNVVAIEPEPENRSWLLMNTKKIRNITVVEKAIWRSNEMIKLTIAEGIGEHSLKRQGGEKIEVEADTLDNIVANLEIDKVNFLKIDIEGAELEALQGAENVIENTEKIVVASHSLHGEPLYPKVEGFLKKQGFRTRTKLGRMEDYIYAKKEIRK